MRRTDEVLARLADLISQQDITETKRQARLVRGCIKRREGRTSIIKDTGGKLLATGQALSGMFVGYEVCQKGWRQGNGARVRSINEPSFPFSRVIRNNALHMVFGF